MPPEKKPRSPLSVHETGRIHPGDPDSSRIINTILVLTRHSVVETSTTLQNLARSLNQEPQPTPTKNK